MAQITEFPGVVALVNLIIAPHIDSISLHYSLVLKVALPAIHTVG